MKSERPNTSVILDGLKDFQRATVEYVFRRLYLDEDSTRRFLVADEVGLGKTLVARGVIARTIDHLWERTNRIDILYVCSNTDIARQNINRLNVTGCKEFSLASRITLLPLTLHKFGKRKINFVSFTPSTSFDLKDNTGTSQEREMLYWMLQSAWPLDFVRATRVLSGYAKVPGFRERTKKLTADKINEDIQRKFSHKLTENPELRSRFDALCNDMPRAGAQIPENLARERNRLIGELRRLLAETCLHSLEPDLIILDEFQRFKHLLKGDAEDASEAAQLAKHLFDFQSSGEDSAAAARVLMLSATPYKMYTSDHESAQDDHYRDFLSTVEFLMQDNSSFERFREQVKAFREKLFRLADGNLEGMVDIKNAVESSLKKIMVRTERLALSADRDGMLEEVKPSNVTLKASDLKHYVDLQRIAKQLDHSDLIEYWKSAPYLLNFMEDYEFKRKLRTAMEIASDSGLAKAVRLLGSGLLDRDEVDRYQRLDPGNARLRALHADTIGCKAWRLLWTPPSLPYYQPSGAFADPDLAAFTKRLVFSSWRVVPKAIASVLSYEAERSMMLRLRSKKPYSSERRSGQLRFRIKNGKPAGLATLGLVYPCRTFAKFCDPLLLAKEASGDLVAVAPQIILDHAKAKLVPLMAPILEKYATQDSRTDDHWYGISPLLMDWEHDDEAADRWLNQSDWGDVWGGENFAGDTQSASGWARHVRFAMDLIKRKVVLGKPPEDLLDVLALMAVAGPGAVSLRALGRVLPNAGETTVSDPRTFAGPLAHSFLHLFNLPEVYCLLRNKNKEIPYWRSVLQYCVAGNLQASMDEYAHILVESLGVFDKEHDKVASEVSEAMSQSLKLRTATAKVDIISSTGRRARIEDENPFRFRTRFAMRFGDQETEDSAAPTRADHVRAAFNSPFWPFVLATTSVGQEGLDFHNYCHAVVHWNLPSNPVDLEQREGRVHRYKGHALRKNIATAFRHAAFFKCQDPWDEMFKVARESRPEEQNDMFPFWITPFGSAKIQRHVPSLPHSRDVLQHAELLRSLVLYRMVFGQNRQEDLMRFLLSQLTADEITAAAEHWRIDLSPPKFE